MDTDSHTQSRTNTHAIQTRRGHQVCVCVCLFVLMDYMCSRTDTHSLIPIGTFSTGHAWYTLNSECELNSFCASATLELFRRIDSIMLTHASDTELLQLHRRHYELIGFVLSLPPKALGQSSYDSSFGELVPLEERRRGYGIQGFHKCSEDFLTWSPSAIDK